jgi:aldehyde dehydrogenase (NAD+)
MTSDWQMYIDGEWRESENSERIDVRNPATAEVFGSAPAGTEGDVDDAVAAASEAYETEWSDWSARERGHVMRDMAQRLEDHFDELVELETRENGKPINESENDVNAGIEALYYYAGAGDLFHGDTMPERDGISDMTVHEPYGVVGIIVPWNWPPMHVIDFLAPVLAAGNTAVLKAPPETPFSAIRIAELFEDLLPDGVFNVVTGDVEPGVAVTNHPDVDKLAFTGNSETGKKVLEAASQDITSAMMELGGKNAALVFPDADLEHTVSGLVEGSFYNSGEACSSSERLLVHEDIYDEFIDRFVEATKDHVTVGDGSDPETTMGPLITQAEVDKVEGYAERAQEVGAELLYSGETPSDPELEDGFYVPPYIFGDVDNQMELFCEEVFGPVVAITPFSDEEEAIELANDVRFGLTGSVWTENGSRSMRVARALEAGMIYVNNYNREMLGLPFGGYKQSGMGRKLAFEETMQEFTRVKGIRFGTDPDVGL